MLVLSRKTREAVVFDGPGRVVVVEIRGDKVRLGFEADRSVTVHREEVAEAIKRDEIARQALADGRLQEGEDVLDARDNFHDHNPRTVSDIPAASQQKQ